MAGTLSATVTPAVGAEIAAALSGSGTLTPAAKARYARAAALGGSGALIATPKPTQALAVPLSGAGALAAAVGQIYAQAAALGAGGTLSAPDLTAIYAQAAALAGSGALSATVGKITAPVFNAISGSTVFFGEGSTTPIPHTAGAGSNVAAIMVVYGSHDSGGSAATGYTVTASYNGVPMTRLGTITANNNVGAACDFIDIWGVLNVATGARNASVNYTKAGGPSVQFFGRVITFNNVSGFGAAQSGFGTEAGTALSHTVSSASGRRILQAFLASGQSSPLGAYTGATSRWSEAQASNIAWLLGDAAGAASVVIGSSRVDGVDYARLAVELLPVIT